MVEQSMEDKSKSARKREAEALQNMAVSMTKFSEARLEQLDLPEDLRQAIRDYKKVEKARNFGALRRQAKFLGRLMREADPEFVARLTEKLGPQKS